MIALAVVVMGLLADQASGVAISVDGVPGDWGITLGPGDTSQWTPLSGVQGSWGGGEDYTGGASGYLYPGYGGQDYDVEAIYFTYDDLFAYFAVVTGFPPTGIGDHAPGDIAIDIGCDSLWDLGIETVGDDGHTVGGLYATDNSDWTPSSHPVSSPYGLKSSATLVWSDPNGANLSYLNSTIGCEHYFIEAAVPLAALDLPDDQCTSLETHWTMSCGNDAIDSGSMTYCPPPPPPPVIPEPMTCTLLGGGLLAVLALRVRQRKRGEAKQPD